MPAHRRKLPHPCPKCRSEFGTVQIVLFHLRRKFKKKISRYDAWNRRSKYKNISHKWNGGRENVVFRIGHYDSTSYAKTKKENDEPYNFQTDETKKKKLRTSQRRWCSFRSEILEQSKFFGLQDTNITKNLPFYDNIRDEVYEYGWEMIEKN